MENKRYAVTVSAKYPAWNDSPSTLYKNAPDRATAIKYAKREMEDSGNSGRMNPNIYRCKEVDANEGLDD